MEYSCSEPTAAPEELKALTNVIGKQPRYSNVLRGTQTYVCSLIKLANQKAI